MSYLSFVTGGLHQFRNFVVYPDFYVCINPKFGWSVGRANATRSLIVRNFSSHFLILSWIFKIRIHLMEMDFPLWWWSNCRRHLSGMKGWVKWAARVVLLWRNGLQGHWTNKMEAQSKIEKKKDRQTAPWCTFFLSSFSILSVVFISPFFFLCLPLCLMSRFSHLLRDFINFFLLLLFAHVTPPCLGKLHALTFGETHKKKGGRNLSNRKKENTQELEKTKWVTI